MTTFKEIRGTAVQSVSSDPSNPESGQIWYNNSIGVLKGYALSAASWGSGGSLSTARDRLSGAGTQTVGLGFGGYSTPIAAVTTATEEYNGSAWTAGGNLGTARSSLGGAGIQTAALGFGGNVTAQVANTEEYTSGPNLRIQKITTS